MGPLHRSPLVCVIALSLGCHTVTEPTPPIDRADAPTAAPPATPKRAKTADSEKRVHAQFKATDSAGQPVAGARFMINDQPIGASSADGQLRVQRAAKEGETWRLDVAPPKGYRLRPALDRKHWTLTVTHPADRPFETTFDVQLQALGDVGQWTTPEAEEGLSMRLLKGTIVDAPRRDGKSIVRLDLALRNASHRQRPVKPMPIILWDKTGRRLANVDPVFSSMRVAESNGRRVEGDAYGSTLAAREVVHISLESRLMTTPPTDEVRMKMEWKSPGQNVFVEGALKRP